MKNADMPAMPQEYTLWCEAIGDCPTVATGLTKREMFTMHFMAAWIQHHGSANNYGFSKEAAAEDAVVCADALLAELERTK